VKDSKGKDPGPTSVSNMVSTFVNLVLSTLIWKTDFKKWQQLTVSFYLDMAQHNEQYRVYQKQEQNTSF